MTNSARRALLLISVLTSVSVITAVVLRAEPPPRAQGGGVAVDFVAVNSSGQPVTDLKPADVSIKVGGKQRNVTSLEFVKASTAGGSTPAASALPPPYHVNAAGGGGGRNLMIVIDNESLKVGTERAVRESLEQVLSQLGPNDRVAFSVAPRDTVQLGFGAGVPAVRAAIAKFTGIRPASVNDSDNQCRSRDSLQLLRAMMDTLAGSETPTSVIYISSGLALPGTVNRNATSSLTCEVLTEHYNGIAAAVATGRENFYVAQGDESNTGRDNGLENLAGVSGAGAVLRATPGGLTRLLTDTAGYYLATVQSDSSDRPGQVQKLEVKVNREGVVTRARPDLAVTVKRAAGGGKAMTPREIVATMTAFPDLPLRVMPVISRGPGGKLNVLTMTESADPAAKITALTAAIFPVGAQKASSAASADEKQLAGKPILVPLGVDPGKYRVRVAAADASGRTGAVDFEVDAELTAAGPMKIGGILLLAPRGENFAPQLQFSDEAEIVPYVELYLDPAAVKLKGAAIDVAATADGPALSTGMPGGQQTNEPDKFIINGKIPIAKLPPGDYVVRVIVQAEGAPEGKVVRTFRKVAK